MSQRFCELYYHLIWTTKNREPLIDSFREGFLLEYLPNKAKSLRCEVLAIGVVKDRIHLLISAPPSKSLSVIVHDLKGSSSHELRHRPNAKDFYWQKGFGAFTVSKQNVEIVKQYVLSQKLHHSDA